MQEILGTTVGAFVGLTLVLFGGFAFMTGQAMAQNWRPRGSTVFYAVLLACGARFLHYALFGGALLSLSGLFVDFAWILVVSQAAYQMVRARRMVSQYPWLYERTGLFTWGERRG